MAQKEQVIATLKQASDRHVGILLDALTEEEIREFNQAETGGAAQIKEKTGLHVTLDRSSGENEFYAWLLSKPDFTVDRLLALHEDKTPETTKWIRDQFAEFQRDLMENYQLGPEGAERLGTLHRTAMEKIAAYRFPDVPAEEIKTAEDMAKVASQAYCLQHMLVDLGQDSSAITADPIRRAAYYQGAGGMMAMQKVESQVHGALFGATYMMEDTRSKSLTALANGFAEFKRTWPAYRGRQVIDPDLSKEASAERIGKAEALHRQGETTQLENMIPMTTDDMRQEAELYLEGLGTSRSWVGMMDAARDEVTDMYFDGAKQEAGDRMYRLQHEPRFHMEERFAAMGDGDYQNMTPAQKQEAAAVFQEIFARPLGYDKLESFYAAEGKEIYDLFRIDGKSVREIADAAGADKLPPAEREQFMQVQIVQAMRDPARNLSVNVPQYVGPNVLKQEEDFREISLRQAEVPMRPAYLRPDIDVGALTKQFVQEGVHDGNLPAAAGKLGDPFTTMVGGLLIPEKDDRKILPRFGKNIYDCVFINGRSVNEIYEERYGQSGLTGSDVDTMKNALIVAERMNPENTIYVRPFDKTADHLVFLDPIAIGMGPELKGVPEETRRAITERNQQFMERYYAMTPEERKAAYPSDPEAVRAMSPIMTHEILERGAAPLREMTQLAAMHPYDMTAEQRGAFARWADSYAQTLSAAEAQKIRDKAALIDAMENPVPRTWSADTLAEAPVLRQAVKDRLAQIREDNLLINRVVREYAQEKPREKEPKDYYVGCDHRDFARMIEFPAGVTSKEEKENYVRTWLGRYMDVPDGRKQCLDEYYDRLDRRDQKVFDLSCLTKGGDHTSIQGDGLTASEHDLIEQVRHVMTTQTRAMKADENPEYIRARYQTGHGFAIFDAGADRDASGIGRYLQSALGTNGYTLSNLSVLAEQESLPMAATAAMQADERYARRRAAAMGKEASPGSPLKLGDQVHRGPESRARWLVDLNTALRNAETGEPLNESTIRFAKNVCIDHMREAGMINDGQEKLERQLGLGDFDSLFVDGKPLTEYVGTKYGNLEKASGEERRKIEDAIQAEFVLAAMSGQHRTERAEIEVGPDGRYQVRVVPYRIDSHILDATERTQEHNVVRRAFDLGATKIETRADKQDKLWQNDPDREKRQEAIRARMGERIVRHAYAKENPAPAPIPQGQYRMARTTTSEDEMYTVNKVQKKRKIAKSDRQAAKEVFGAEIYDEIDEARKGTDAEREIALHSSRGQRQLSRGESVLELEFAGSDYARMRRDYTGITDKVWDEGRSDPEMARRLEELYGPQMEGREHVRVKETTVPVTDPATPGQTMTKKRISIGGPGLLNHRFEEHNIDRNREFATAQATEYLRGELDKAAALHWDGKPLKPIHVDLSGHSRGAVAAGETVRSIHEWMEANKDKYPKEVMDQVRFDIIQYDPVPGFGDRTEHGKLDLSDVPGVNSTVVYSLSTEHDDITFKPQEVKGADRIIFGVTAHSVKLGETDRSQVDPHEVKGNKVGYFDPATGEVYRGSGLSDMKDGIYFSDERANVIRVTSLSQIDQLADVLFEGNDARQERRLNVIKSSAKDWFMRHDLELSYSSEEERQRAADGLTRRRDELNALPNSPELDGIRDSLRELDRAVTSGDQNAIKTKSEAVRDKCRDYMRGIDFPTDPETEKKVAIAGDILSTVQRDQNYRTRGLDKSAVKERTGAVERQLDREEERLQKAGKIQGTILQSVAESKELLERLKQTKKSGENSKSYEKLKTALERVGELSPNSSIRDAQKVFDELAAAGAEYDKEHSGLTKARSKDGKERRAISQLAAKLGSEAGATVRENSREIADKDRGITQLIDDRGKKVDKLQVEKKKITRKALEAKAVEAHEMADSAAKKSKTRKRSTSMAVTPKELEEAKKQVKSAPPVAPKK